MNDRQQYEEYAQIIDNLIIHGDYEGLRVYLAQIESMIPRQNSDEPAALFYYLGTGYGALAYYLQQFSNSSADADVRKCRKLSLFYMRKAIMLFEQEDQDSLLLLPAYTNYANELDSCGRVIEALRIYRKAINIDPAFGMAIGNYGRALNFYANMVNDNNHRNVLHIYAYQEIKKALKIKGDAMHDDAIKSFYEIVTKYNTFSFNKEILEAPMTFDKYDLGGAEEKRYRIWCLKKHLFLNPLNDLIEGQTAFAHDPLTITQYTEYVNLDNDDNTTPPKWFAMLNQLKEEYIYSRFLYYEGTEKSKDLHFADKNVKLSLSSFDYVNYSIRIEQLKSAFKNLYSIFDQIGFVINEFWNLGFNEREADASHVFKCEKYPSDNVALTALYWSYCELWESFGNAEGASERDLKILRNALEHKFVKIHEYPVEGKLQIKNDKFYHICESELKKYTFRVMELAREWIMELVYAIGIEERKNTHRNETVQFSLQDYDDEWKI